MAASQTDLAVPPDGTNTIIPSFPCLWLKITHHVVGLGWVVGTVTSQLEGSGFDSRLGKGGSDCSLHVLPVLALVSYRFFLLHSQKHVLLSGCCSPNSSGA